MLFPPRKSRYVIFVFSVNQARKYIEPPVELKPKHTTVGSGRGGAGRDGDEQNGTPTGLFAPKKTVPLSLQMVEKTLLGCVSGSTTKGNPMQTDGGTKPQLMSVLSVVYLRGDGRSSCLVADQSSDALLVL